MCVRYVHVRNVLTLIHIVHSLIYDRAAWSRAHHTRTSYTYTHTLCRFVSATVQSGGGNFKYE